MVHLVFWRETGGENLNIPSTWLHSSGSFSRTNKVIDINKENNCRVLIDLLGHVTSFDLDPIFRVKVKGRKNKTNISQKTQFLKIPKKCMLYLVSTLNYFPSQKVGD